MEEYQEISIWGYQNSDRDPEEEYYRRYNAPGTVHTGLTINPIFRGERSEKTFELFLVPIFKVLSLDNVVNDNSKKILKLISDLPGIAANQLFSNTLVNEIMSTNEIEDVKTTSQEVNDAISNIDSKRQIRLKSFVRMYFKIKNQENLKIESLSDIRNIYDYLLEGEIPENKLPDGKLFRNSFTRIGSETKTVHLPKTYENDFLPDLLEWIRFINGNQPSLFKAFIAHYYFEYIHPFNDGNGRTGRYIACVYLGYKLDPLTAIIFSSEINSNRKDYYKAFVDVENQKNYGEITFFVERMLKILVKGQKKLIKDLTKKKNLLDYGQERIEKKYDKLDAECLFLYYQAFLFNDSGLGIEDRELKKYISSSNAATRRCIDTLTNEGKIEITKKSPLTRKLTNDFVDELIS